jgi:hypothetical protein
VCAAALASIVAWLSGDMAEEQPQEGVQRPVIARVITNSSKPGVAFIHLAFKARPFRAEKSVTAPSYPTKKNTCKMPTKCSKESTRLFGNTIALDHACRCWRCLRTRCSGGSLAGPPTL